MFFVCHLWREDLDGKRFTECDMTRFVDRSKPPSSDTTDEFIVASLSLDERRPRVVKGELTTATL
tara:strand:+ start:5343 stop:5537 length:195 start_codon:yes stop_codon:yes gene_type:complete